jgi:16S rRNA G966 N2-methylase RsmD
MINLKEEHSKFVKLYSFSKGATSPTNRKLAEEIISHLDDEIFKNPNSKFLDPCAGTGTFGVVLYNRLLKYHDSKWIFEKMIFMVDTSLVNCDLLKKLGFVNVYKQDFLNLKLDMKFDIIIGNPPYQEHEHSSIKLWKKFVIKTENILKSNGILAFVIPSSWSKPLRKTSKGNDRLCGEIFRKHTLINYNLNVNHYFKSVGIDISYVLLIKDNKESNFSHIHKNTIVSSILSSIMKNSSQFIELLHYADTPWHRGVIRNSEKTIEFSIPLVENVDKFYYTNVDDLNLRKRKKIHIPRVFGFNFIGDDGHYGLGYQAECILLKENESVEYALNYFNSKLISTILKEVKWIPQADYSVIELLPRLDFSKNWSDSDLYKEFNLTQEEIDYIENYVG